MHFTKLFLEIHMSVCCFHLQYISVLLCYIVHNTPSDACTPIFQILLFLSLSLSIVYKLKHWHISYPIIVLWKSVWRRLSIILWFANSKNEAYLFVATYTPFNSNHQLMGLLHVSIYLLVITSTVQYAHHLIQHSDFNCF